MRSLWRMLALQWLGGEGSEALAGESTILDLLGGDVAAVSAVFDVQRDPGVSHHAMISPSAGSGRIPEPVSKPELRDKFD